ncbi:hypothetical protein ACPW96_07765 [Micromonospora sp. DT81.3]|uniref:hypothetical protein n=1 Tax=Micromonospora sp. DT81.3 TaxID=3416523 RepID=UPI003CF53062
MSNRNVPLRALIFLTLVPLLTGICAAGLSLITAASRATEAEPLASQFSARPDLLTYLNIGWVLIGWGLVVGIVTLHAAAITTGQRIAARPGE